MKTFKLILILFAILPLTALCQSNFRPGYVVKNNGDTLKGFINYRNWKLSPKDIEFKQKSTDKTPATFDVSALKSFQITHMDSYVAYTGPVSNDKNNMPDLPYALDVTKHQDNAFLKVLNTGKNVTLLYNADSVKSRYFIMEKASMPQELVFHQYFNEQGRVNIDATFRTQLMALLKKYNPADTKGANKLLSADFVEGELIRYAQIINNNYDEAASKFGTRIVVGAGAAYTYSEFSGPDGFGYSSYGSSVSPLISAGIDLINNPNIQTSFLRIEASIVGISPSFPGTVANFSVKQYIFSVDPQVIYNLYNTDKLKIFVDGGIGFSLSTNSSKLVANKSGVIVTPTLLQNLGDTYTSLKTGDTYANPYDVRTTGMNILLKAGMVINKKIEIYAAAMPYLATPSTDYYSYSNFGMSVGLNYFFKIK